MSSGVAGSKSSGEMAAEALREIGILLITFAPLYKMYENSKASGPGLAITLAIAIAAFVGGVELEQRRGQ